MNKKERIEGFVQEIWAWYSRHKRALPWRDLKDTDDTERAYKILVSEVMLQQTQVSRVIIIFRQFLETFPTIQDLAKATNKEVIVAWKGMGYNSRALRLRDAARTIVDQYAGIFPQKYDQLLAIKGIGPYTAAAIRNFAFNIPTPCIDTNIRRILHRTFFGPENADGSFEKSDKELMKTAKEVLHVAIHSQFSILNSQFRHGSADWHAALMDFGSLIQTKNNPKWDICPLTAKGIMKTTSKNFFRHTTFDIRHTRPEPGRMEGSKYVPNRIFRGRIVDQLREESTGLTLEKIGSNICNDWGRTHQQWLKKILEKLERDEIIAKKGAVFLLKE